MLRRSMPLPAAPAPDPTVDPRVAAIFEEFAESSGWPRGGYYDECLAPLHLLAQVPGTFVAEVAPVSCPIKYAPLRATYDLIPRLLQDGQRGRALVFGYGRAWYALGDDVLEAGERLQQRYRFQSPHCQWVEVAESVMETASAQSYLEWLVAQLRPAAGPEATLG